MSVQPIVTHPGMNNPQESPITTVESLCIKCQKNGITSFLFLHLPHFKETLLSRFECPHCGFKNKEVANISSLQDFGLKITLQVTTPEDLNRQIVKSEFCSVQIPELELELPALVARELEIDNDTHQSVNRSAVVTTVEGLLNNIIGDLEMDQETRQSEFPDIHEKISVFIGRIKSLLIGAPFYLILDDPSGNSYVEPVLSGDDMDLSSDVRLENAKYSRTPEQLQKLGYGEKSADVSKLTDVDTNLEENDIYEFPGVCPSCHSSCMTRMHPLVIPYFKEVIIMATVCDSCYFKSSEVKSGSSISPKGSRISLRLESKQDLSRDILKSETCSLIIPEIELELNYGTLGGRFTTIEGLLVQIKEELTEKASFSIGDSARPERKSIFSKLLSNLEKISLGELPCTVILDDPFSNSYIQNLYAPDPDPQLSYEEYDRTFEQNEDFGVNDMST